jgi:hypothetical protein
MNTSILILYNCKEIYGPLLWLMTDFR